MGDTHRSRAEPVSPNSIFWVRFPHAFGEGMSHGCLQKVLSPSCHRGFLSPPASLAILPEREPRDTDKRLSPSFAH